MEIAVARINQYIDFVAMGWLLGMVVLSARLAGGLWYLQRLRHHHTCPLPAWEATTNILAARLRLRRPVAIMASGQARVPMVIGHLKPLILLPVALISSFPPEQIEAIIAHELAHVRRHDYWINMLQSVGEVIFFYHPAVRWLSSVVREEREKCCDDLAVSLNGNAIAYAKALAEAERLQHTADPLVIAFAPQRGSLLSRIERLVGPRTSPTRLAAKGWFIVPMLLVVTYLAGGDTLARKATPSEPPLTSGAFSDISKRLPSRTEVSVAPLANQAQEDSDSGSTTNAVPDLMASDTIPGKDKDKPSSFSFHFNDSTNFSFDMNFNFDEEDSAAHHGFRHWRFSSSDTFPDFTWNDSLWRESIGELGETMEMFSEELATYLEDSVDTKALQQRMNSVQRELSRLQAEIGTSMQRAFSDEEMEALQKELQEEQERLQRELLDEQSWRNEESNRNLEELKRLTEEMEQQSWFDDENDSLRLKEVERALDSMPQWFKDEGWDSEENAQRLKEVEQALEDMSRQFGDTAERASKERYRQLAEAMRALDDSKQQSENHLQGNFDNTVTRLEKALLADGLITSGKKYRFELKPKGLYINKKKQDGELLDKYRDLLDITESTSFSITRTAR